MIKRNETIVTSAMQPARSVVPVAVAALIAGVALGFSFGRAATLLEEEEDLLLSLYVEVN